MKEKPFVIKYLSGLTLGVIVIGIVVVFVAAVSLAMLQSFIKKELGESTLENTNAVVLKFSPDEGTYKKGEFNTTTLVLSVPNNEIAGMDVEFSYDLEQIEIIRIRPNSEMKYIPQNKDSIEPGIMKFSLLIKPGLAVKGVQELATIEWRAVEIGDTSVVFNFTPGITTDSNVAEFGTGKDVLEVVRNATYTIVR